MINLYIWIDIYDRKCMNLTPFISKNGLLLLCGKFNDHNNNKISIVEMFDFLVIAA
jgi:hypothetical protein